MNSQRESLPPRLELVREEARRAIAPVSPASAHTVADKDFLFKAQETAASAELPPYYLVYFLMVDLLGFRNLGRFEKIDWSIPLDFEGRAFLLEHRKFGLGLFAHDAAAEEAQARQIVRLVNDAARIAQPFFDWYAEQAIKSSKLNVQNASLHLFERFDFLRTTYNEKSAEAVRRKAERHKTEHE